MKGGYGIWQGQSVILKVSVGGEHVPLRGTIVGETSDAVRFRIGDGWDVDIYKAMVLSVEEDSWVSIVT